MRSEDFIAITSIGNALWVNPRVSERNAADTVAAVAMLEVTDENAVEKAASAMLVAAMRDGVHATISAISNPFYRLLPEERTVLAALHCGRWSYERLGRVLGRAPDEIAEIAWNSRLHLASAPGTLGALTHPSGSRHRGVSCPEYDSKNPWTQRFLDEESTNRERVFLQNHLMACDSCRKALELCRNLYYAVEKLIPGGSGGLGANEPAVQRTALNLQKHWKESRFFKYPAERSLTENLTVFLRRWDVQLYLVSGAALMIVLGLL